MRKAGAQANKHTHTHEKGEGNSLEGREDGKQKAPTGGQGGAS